MKTDTPIQELLILAIEDWTGEEYTGSKGGKSLMLSLVDLVTEEFTSNLSEIVEDIGEILEAHVDMQRYPEGRSIIASGVNQQIQMIRRNRIFMSFHPEQAYFGTILDEVPLEEFTKDNIVKALADTILLESFDSF